MSSPPPERVARGRAAAVKVAAGCCCKLLGPSLSLHLFLFVRVLGFRAATTSPAGDLRIRGLVAWIHALAAWAWPALAGTRPVNSAMDPRLQLVRRGQNHAGMAAPSGRRLDPRVRKSRPCGGRLGAVGAVVDGLGGLGFYLHFPSPLLLLVISPPLAGALFGLLLALAGFG